MSLTFSERKQYLKDRLANAARMLRNRNFKLFWESLLFEINHGKNLFRMWWHLRTEVVDSTGLGSEYINKTKVLPASWRPTVYRPASPTVERDSTRDLTGELRRIISSLTIAADRDRKVK